MTTQPAPDQPQWQQPPPAQTPPPKKSRRGCLIASLIIVAVIIIGAVSCTALIAGTAKNINDQSNQQHTAVYTVTGTGAATDITYSTEGGSGTSQDTNAKLPWTKTVSSKGFLNIYSLTAQNGINSSGAITCKIVVDGKKISENTSTGAGAIASCSGAGQ